MAAATGDVGALYLKPAARGVVEPDAALAEVLAPRRERFAGLMARA